MALLSGVLPTFATGAGPGPGPVGHYFPPPPQSVLDRLGRRENTDHYYHVVQKQPHPLQDKLNQIKHLLQEKFQKKFNRGGGGHYEHSSHDKPKDQSAAISALTLLAFLFFLYILQSCIRDHMNQMAAATTTTTTAAPVVVFRERANRQSPNFQKIDRKGESEQDDYEEYPEEISVKLPSTKDNEDRYRSSSAGNEVRHRSASSALQVYKKPENYDNYRYMEPVKLIVKP